MSLADQDARDAIRTALTDTLVIEAAAGTGKTTALVGRIVSLLATGTTTLSRIAAVTFTEKASGEMKLRLRAAIERARSTEDERVRARLDTALTELETAHIGTIHGFCAELLRERPVQAGLDPLFAVLDENASEALFDEVFAVWWTDTLADMPSALRRMLRRASERGDGARETVRRAAWQQCGWRDHRGPWATQSLDRTALIDRAVDALRAFAAFADRPRQRPDRAIAHLLVVRAWIDDLDHRESQEPRDPDAVEARLSTLNRLWSWTHKPYHSNQGGFTAAELTASRDGAKATLTECMTACDADLAERLHRLLWPVVDAYSATLRDNGGIDYFDLLARTATTLAADDAVRHDLQERFTHLLVDEFQDTDPLQADILLLLSADDPAVRIPDDVRPVPGKLFIVGDPKQSIYRFRRADVSLYLRIRDRLVQQGARVLHLSTSFRSDPRIQSVVNHAFAAVMTGGTQADYVPLRPFRAPDTSRPAVIALSLPEPYSPWGRVTIPALRTTEPAAVARFVEWLLAESRWTVTDPRSGRPVALAAHHICLLFRRLQSWQGPVAAPFATALEAVQQPTVLVGGRSLHDREEVAALRTVLTAIERPDDTLAVYSALRGPFFAVGDDALLLWTHTVGPVDPRARPYHEDPLFDEVSAALAVLHDLHKQRNLRPLADTVHDLLDRTRAHAGLALWSGGAQVLANVLSIVEQARSAERSGTTSFRAFVQTLERQARRRTVSEASALEDGTEGVRIMSVHKAKGLEFPVVILCDASYAGVTRYPGRWLDHDTHTCANRIAGLDPLELSLHRDALLTAEREEADRLLYVAATRARDVLVIPAVADGPYDGWTSSLHPALYPAPSAWRDSDASPGCPAFGTDATVVRPPDRAPPPDSGVRPGRHVNDGLDVTWWDGHRLGPPPVAEPGFRKVDGELLSADRDLRHALVAERHANWQRARDQRTARASQPSTVVVTPSHSEGISVTLRDVSWEQVPGVVVGRPSGRTFGTLVHAVLAEVPFDAETPVIDALTLRHARLLGADVTDAEAAAHAVYEALKHEVFAQSRAADRVERELPIAHHRDDGVFIEGSADLVFWDADGVVVVDFKTDVDVSERRDAYVRQLSLYADALEAATGCAVRAIALGV